MKVKYVVWTILAIAAVVFAVYLLNVVQLRLEQSIGKFLTWTVVLLLVFLAGWIVGRFGGRGKTV